MGMDEIGASSGAFEKELGSVPRWLMSDDIPSRRCRKCTRFALTDIAGFSLAAIATLAFVAYATASPGTAAAPAAKRLMNTDPACVSMAEQVLAQTAASDLIDRLVKCLPGEQFYFDNGAVKAALVQIGEPAVPALVQALDSPNYAQSEGAAQTLGAMGPRARAAVPDLKAVLLQKPKPGMLQPYAAQALGKIGEIDFLVRAIQHQEPGVSDYLGAQGLGAAGAAAIPAVPALLEMLNSSDASTQMYAANALGQLGPAASPAIARLGVLSKSEWNFVRTAAGEALAKIGTPEAQEAGMGYQRRKALFDAFFKTMAMFVGHPLYALGVGIGFLLWAIAGFASRREKTFSNGSLLLPAVCWMLYAWEEGQATLSRADIRVDLLFIYPLLAGVTLLCVAIWLGSLISSKQKDPV